MSHMNPGDGAMETQEFQFHTQGFLILDFVGKSQGKVMEYFLKISLGTLIQMNGNMAML